MTDDDAVHPLIAEAAKKAQVCWVATDDSPAKSLWCLNIDGVLAVVCGPGEQHDPGLSAADACRVTLRGDHNGRILTFEATIDQVTPGDDRWDEVASALSAKRLNSGAGDTVARWAAECSVYRLVPSPTPPTAGAELPDASLAAVREPSTAARATRRPFRLHKVRGRR